MPVALFIYLNSSEKECFYDAEEHFHRYLKKEKVTFEYNSFEEF